jgi:hypothetical protein
MVLSLDLAEITAHDVIQVTGDRNWGDLDFIERVFSWAKPGSYLIHGAADGADTACGIAGEKRGLVVIKVPYIRALGRAGGPVRNGHMVTIANALECIGKNVIVLAFHPDLTKSKGTKDMVKRCTKVQFRIIQFTGKETVPWAST